MPTPERRDERGHAGDRGEFLRELEAAWEQWVRGNPPSDARTSSLLRAAFAAGYQAGHDAARES